MTILFWFCFALTVYAYFGYALCLALYVRIHRRPFLTRPITPTVSIIIAARNEQANLPTKFENLRAIRYPAERLQIVIASDGSTDATPELILQNAPFVLPVILDQSNGKGAALNAAVAASSGEILVFLDARQSVESHAIAELVSCFADPSIGAVSGELLLADASGTSGGNALGIYWKIEKFIRKLESASGSVIGVTGAIYAVRRELYTPIPIGTILDDVFVPMNVARAGRRVIFHPAAIARDQLFAETGKEFSRKVRTLTGNYQLLRLLPWLLSPANPLLFRFISHKFLRLLVPAFLVCMLVASILVVGRLYRAILIIQLLFYLLAAFGAVRPSLTRFRPVALANTFVMLNAAAALAFYNFVMGRNRVWVR